MHKRIETTKEVTEANILLSMEQESMWDTLLEDFVMPMELYNQIKDAQKKWQAWLNEKAGELMIDPVKVKEARRY